MFSWFNQTTKTERLTFWACFGGWAVDALDSQMFSLALPAIISTFALTSSQAGSLASVTLISSAIGGWLAGALSDRFGRVRLLQLTILWFSVFTFLSSITQSFTQLLIIKSFQGLGFGGEWAAGAVLLAEVMRPELRGRSIGSVQSAWAWGWGGSVLLYTLIFSFLPPIFAWRVMFAIGLLPALLVIYVQRSVPEPITKKEKNKNILIGFGIFSPKVLRATLVGGFIGLGAHGGYYALMTWLPTYLKTQRGLSILSTGGYLSVIIIAFGCGCLTSANLQDRIGRKKTIILFAVCCVITVLSYLILPLSNHVMLVLGFPLGFFAAGIPASLGTLFNELYPAGIRGTGVGFCYNFGRIASAAFPWLVGNMSKSMPLGTAIGIDAAAAYTVVIIAILFLPETKATVLLSTQKND
jgi:MFS family permease